MKTKEMIKNTTIAFSGYNIKLFAILAIESFLLYYPEMRDNVVYFDDESIDGTKEELEKRGIKVITWTKKWKDKYQKLYDEGFLYDMTQMLSSRVCFIMREIMEQTKTKYLLISDGDVVFKKGDFLENYMEGFKNGNKIVFHKEYSEYKKDYLENEIKKGKRFKRYEYYKKHEIKKGNYYNSPRVHLLHSILDLEYFKKIDMLGDRLEKDVFDVMIGGLVDTGTDFYRQIVEKDIERKIIPSEDVYSTIYHLSWLSSSNRDTNRDNNNSMRNHLSEIKEFVNEEEYNNIIKKVGLEPKNIIRFYQKMQRKKRKKLI